MVNLCSDHVHTYIASFTIRFIIKMALICCVLKDRYRTSTFRISVRVIGLGAPCRKWDGVCMWRVIERRAPSRGEKGGHQNKLLIHPQAQSAFILGF